MDFNKQDINRSFYFSIEAIPYDTILLTVSHIKGSGINSLHIIFNKKGTKPSGVQVSLILKNIFIRLT